MREVVLRIKMSDSWMAEIGTKYDRPVKFLDCMPYDGSGGKGLIEIDCAEEDMKELIEIIRNHPNVSKIDISPSPDGGVIGSVVCHNKCAACKSLMGSNCFLMSASSGNDGYIEWKLLAGKEDSLSRLIQKLKEFGCEVDLVTSRRLNKKRMLTGRQEEIIRIALMEGYYDIPKRTSINKLATSFNVAPSTLAEIIQRAERKIIGQYFNKYSR